MKFNKIFFTKILSIGLQSHRQSMKEERNKNQNIKIFKI